MGAGVAVRAASPGLRRRQRHLSPATDLSSGCSRAGPKTGKGTDKTQFDSHKKETWEQKKGGGAEEGIPVLCPGDQRHPSRSSGNSNDLDKNQGGKEAEKSWLGVCFLNQLNLSCS